MHQYHRSQTKKVSSGTGGKRVGFMDKRIAHLGRPFTATKAAKEDKKETVRARSGARKIRLKKAAFVNVMMEKGKSKKAKINKVIESHNSEYVRQNIITKGAVLDTDVGKVKVTNRVGQDGLVNGILVK